MAVPIAMCASEVWGRYGTHDIDRLHMNIYLLTLGVRIQRVSGAVLGELGRFPLSMFARARCLTYWCKFISNSDNTVHSILLDQCDSLLNKQSNG